MECGAQAAAQVARLGADLAGARLVGFLDVVVVGADDRVLALEIVVSGAEREAGPPGDVAHRRLVEAALAEQIERGRDDLAAGLLAAGALRQRPHRRLFEHVQKSSADLPSSPIIF